MSHTTKKVVLIGAVVTITFAYIYNITGKITKRSEDVPSEILSESELRGIFEFADDFEFQGEPLKYYKLYRSDKLIGYAFLTTDISPEFCGGYATTIKTLVGITTDGKVLKVVVLEHYETPQYVDDEKLERFLLQFNGKSISDNFVLNEDIDSITGATITSNAIVESVRESIKRFSSLVLSKETKDESKPGVKLETLNIVLLIFIFCLSVYGLLSRKPKGLRYLLLGVCILFLGFYTTTMVSLVNIVNNITFRLPTLSSGLLYYFFAGFVVITTVLLGRLYCGWNCPFGAIEEFVWRLKVRVFGKNTEGTTAADYRYTKYIMLWIVVAVAFILDRPNLANYEPFATLFDLTGNTLFVFLVISSLIGGIFFYRFYCRYFCPSGTILGLCSTVSLFKLRILTDRCNRCGLCVKVCRLNAITTQEITQEIPKIDIKECIQCNECVINCPRNAIVRKR